MKFIQNVGASNQNSPMAIYLNKLPPAMAYSKFINLLDDDELKQKLSKNL